MYSRKVGEQVITLGHEGTLYRQSFVMYDKQTNSLWVHTTGEAINGAMKGKVLTFVPSTVTSWKRWKAMHPGTTVLTGQRGSKFMGTLSLYDRPAQYGLSIGQGTGPKIYPFAELMRVHVVNDSHAGTPVVVVYEPESRTAKAYERGAHTFAWKDGTLVDETGCAWDPLFGTQSKPDGARLKEVPSTPWLLKRWRGFYPRGPMYAAK